MIRKKQLGNEIGLQEAGGSSYVDCYMPTDCNIYIHILRSAHV